MENLGGLLRYPLDQIPFVIIALILAFTIHEFAHAYLADRFGDPTPRSMGRVSLNPRVHIDWLGTLLIFLIGFGWAKPVIINPLRFKHRRLMTIAVSVAGPISNLVLAFLGMLVLYMADVFQWFPDMSIGSARALALFLYLLISLNMMLFIFNLLPLPPLDGYRILFEMLPVRSRIKLQQYEQWAIYLFLLFVFIPPLYRATLGPIFGLTDPILTAMARLLDSIFGHSELVRRLLGLG